MRCWVVLLLLAGHACASYDYETFYFDQKIDHFNADNDKTFKNRYMVNTKSWGGNGDPIFFYAGNEGDITLFIDNTGFMWEIADEFKAMIVFAEHRFYGESMPYADAYTPPYQLGLLTSSQVLADFASLGTHIRQSLNATDSALISFGGSYGGMLAAWFRMKYPHITQGALASSAPILQFTGMVPCHVFGQIVTEDFQRTSLECTEVVRRSWAAIDTVTSTDEGKEWLSTAWGLCKPLETRNDVLALKNLLVNVLVNLAMIDYPYPASFLMPLPAYPIKAFCEDLRHPKLEPEPLLEEYFLGLNVYFNYTGEMKCVNTSQQADPRLGDIGWWYQACSEMIMPMCYDGVDDFFEPVPWDLASYVEECHRVWGVTPDAGLAELLYGGKNIQAASNIVFSNGLLDPWHSGGVMEDVNPTVVALIIPEGAHHIDLRSSNPDDPPSLTATRRLEKEHISRWIRQYAQEQMS
ncbi:lysosomal Pro-X carboxypeptidase-like [Oratosquilla oratoria]|uniref:lysosomal Pro-X carboxypeptidase-like n=1 Tax=Oratosquilla oratoria TaxID=337810 RepID=UPI003F7771A6